MGLSGCDTVAPCYGIGKMKILKTWRKSFFKLSWRFKCQLARCKSGNIFHACLLWCSKTWQHDTGKSKPIEKKSWKRSSTMPKLYSLPPTDPGFMENLKRAHFQMCIWKHALDLNVPDLDPAQCGWTKDKAAKSLVAVHVPPKTDLALS